MLPRAALWQLLPARTSRSFRPAALVFVILAAPSHTRRRFCVVTPALQAGKLSRLQSFGNLTIWDVMMLLNLAELLYMCSACGLVVWSHSQAM
jgi:hypothetical protein